MHKKYIASILSLTAAFAAFAGESDKVDYIPKIGGAIRARWEIETADGYNRFALRNARVKLRGNIARPVQYYLQADLCNQGKMQFLDGWVRLNAFTGFNVQAGQFRIPFGVDPFRGPGSYVFANRSFIGRDIDNIRAVGVKASYIIPGTGLTVEGGVFSPGTITDHSKWTRQKAFASKAVWNVGDFSIATGFQSIIPDSIRINMADAAITFRHGRVTAEAEYMYKHYTGDAFSPCHAYNVWADYAIPLHKGLFNRLSFQGRIDGSTAHSSGIRDADGHLKADQPYRNRFTVGSTIAYIKAPMKCELQLNYEKYLYHSDYDAPRGRGDKIVAELIVTF